MRFVLGILLTAGLVLAQPSGKQSNGKSTPVPEWRRSTEAFSSALYAYTGEDASKPSEGAKQVPSAGFDDFANGGVVTNDWEVMRRFGGDIEWEAVFDGMDKGSAERPEKLKFKINGLFPLLHAYPAPSALEKWKSVTAGTSIRFRGTIEGIAGTAMIGKMILIVTIRDVTPLP